MVTMATAAILKIGIKTTKIKTKSSQCNRSMYISKQENVSYKNNEQNYLSKQLSYEHDSLNKQNAQPFGKYVGLGGNNLTIMLKTNTLF
jgi:predicted RNA-binding protein YlxR (DUF448 family)